MRGLSACAFLLAAWLAAAGPASAYDLPETDPPPENPVDLVPALRSVHPRLLFTAADVPGMQARAVPVEGASHDFYEQLLAYLPVCRPPGNTDFQTDATEAQRQGFWRMPTVALHYILTGNTTSFDRAKGYLQLLLDTDHWELGTEEDSGMGAANMLVGAALTFDWLYNDLDATFRTNFRNKLLLQARRMYYLGHLQNNADSHYWQQDSQNNHRHHRDAGLVLAVLAVASPDETDDDWILSKTFEELQFVHQWLPPDGSCHEGPTYMPYGYIYLTLAMDASDRCFGTTYLDHDFFRTAPGVRFATMTPNLLDTFSYGDTNGGTNFLNNYLLKMTAHHRLADEQAAFFRAFEANSDCAFYGWSSIIWHDPTVPAGDIDNLQLVSYHSDLGLAMMRDGWETAGTVGAMFKCGPYGGAKLNQYRNENSYHYINVAHDDPDAGEFLIYVNNVPVARTDGYSETKLTSGHNTILVGGAGQRGEGSTWTQPLGGVDMTTLAKVLRWHTDGDLALIEGEAGAAYNGLARYRRTFVWVENQYVLVLDDIRPTTATEITWLVQSASVQVLDAGERRYRLVNGAAQCDFQLASDQALTATVGTSTARNRSTLLGLQQLQARATVTTWRLAAVFDPWQRGGVTVALTPDGPEEASVTVTGPDFEDEWTWQAAPDNQTPSTVQRGPSPVTVTGWAVVADHGPAGILTTTVADNDTEPRLAGLGTVQVTFSKALNPGTVGAGAVTIEGAQGGDVSGLIQSLALDAGDTMLTVGLSSPLPDADTYTVAVSAAVQAADGGTLWGDAELTIRALAGDVDGSGAVSAADVLAVRAAAGTPVAADTARYDLDASGAATGADLLDVRARLGHALP